VVDRRFNRSRYNAEAVVAEFSARLRQTVDLDAVRQDLVGVVHEVFQPTAVSMWLGPGPDQPLGSGQEFAGFQQGLEGGQDARPALCDAGKHGTSGIEVVVSDGQLHHLASWTGGTRAGS
jgi:hypothetical protein